MPSVPISDPSESQRASATNENTGRARTPTPDRPRSIYDLPREQLIELIAELREPAYRGKQIWKALYAEGITSFDALVEIGMSRPDLVILDVVMPVIDGASLCASMKANPATRAIKLIGITGKRLSGSKLRFIKRNTDAFFRKPLDIQKLLAKSASLLRVALA